MFVWGLFLWVDLRKCFICNIYLRRVLKYAFAYANSDYLEVTLYGSPITTACESDSLQSMTPTPVEPHF